jgi:hypothetical protein
MLTRLRLWGFLCNFSCRLEGRQSELTNFSEKSHPTNNWLGCAFPFSLGTRGPAMNKFTTRFPSVWVWRSVSLCVVCLYPEYGGVWIFPAQRVLKKIFYFPSNISTEVGYEKNLGKIIFRPNNFRKNCQNIGCIFYPHSVSAIDFSSVGKLDSLTSKLIAAATIAPTLPWRLYVDGHLSTSRRPLIKKKKFSFLLKSTICT